jgi:hypothetical protein
MVAMGSSFADQAWGRESAVYRVAGVINVIAGWLITAAVAFLTSGVFAMILFYTGTVGPIVLTALAAFLLIRSHLAFNKKTKEEKDDNRLLEIKHFNVQVALSESKLNTTKTLKTIQSAISLSINALLNENPAAVRKSLVEIQKLKLQNEKFNSKVIKLVGKMEKGNLSTGRLYILVFDMMQDLYQSVQLINEIITTHISNHHNTPKKKYAELLSELDKGLREYMDMVELRIETGKSNIIEIKDRNEKLMTTINKSLDNLVNDIQKDDIGNRMGLLLTRLLLELKDIVTSVDRLHEIYQNHDILSATDKK